jgi:hypothetical protein
MEDCFDYEASPYTVPESKAAVHRSAWDNLSRPGSWWTARERIAIAQASRTAFECSLCRERKSAPSPFSVSGEHEGSSTVLDAQVIDTVHRITTDSARLTRLWVEGLLSDDFGYGHYIELIGVIVAVISIDTVHRALGIPLEPLPDPKSGDPDEYWPAGATIDVGWVPMIQPANLTEREKDIFFGAPRMGHVIRALSLVPDAVRWLSNLSAIHYIPVPQVMDLTSTGELSLSRMQTELVAARTSILNDCFY